jgi:hypothetical protein
MKKYYSYLKENKQQTLLEVIDGVLNKKIEPNILKKYLGDEFMKFDINEIDETEIIIICEDSDVENIMGVEEGVIRYINGIEYDEYYVDEDESKYIFNMMNEKTIKLVKEFAKELEYDIILNEEGVYDFFKYLKLSDIFDEYITSLSIANHDALNRLVYKEITSIVPFEIDYFRKTQLIIILEKLKKYIETNDKDFETITEVFKHIGNNVPYSYEISYELDDYIDYSDVEKELYDSISKIYDGYLTDNFWMNIISKDNITLFKKYYKKYNWNNSIQYKWYVYEMIHNLPEEILPKKSEIYKFIRTDSFYDNIKPLMNSDLFDKTKNKVKYEKIKKFNL